MLYASRCLPLAPPVEGCTPEDPRVAIGRPGPGDSIDHPHGHLIPVMLPQSENRNRNRTMVMRYSAVLYRRGESVCSQRDRRMRWRRLCNL